MTRREVWRSLRRTLAGALAALALVGAGCAPSRSRTDSSPHYVRTPAELVPSTRELSSFESAVFSPRRTTSVRLRGFTGGLGTATHLSDDCDVEASLGRPDHRIEVRDAAMPLRLEAVSDLGGLDIEIVVADPDGALHCQTEGTDSREILERTFAPGMYSVWIGVVEGGRRGYKLTIDAQAAAESETSGVRDLGDSLGRFEGEVVASEAPLESRNCVDGSHQRIFSWKAPRTSVYDVDTRGSAVDTILFARFGALEGVELGCNDDQPDESTWSAIRFRAVAGDVLYFVVSKFPREDDATTFYLTIAEADSPPAAAAVVATTVDLGQSSDARSGMIDATAGTLEPRTCAAEADRDRGAAEAVFAFTAPSDGTYHLSAVGSQFDSVMYARLARADGVELACVDDCLGSEDPQLWLRLAAGDRLFIVLDSYRQPDEPVRYAFAIERER